MAVAAICAGDPIPGLQDARESDSHGFLARVKVSRTVDLAAQEQALDSVLETSDERHRPVQLNRELVVHLLYVVRSGQ
jgi:hypothetical protein